MIEYIDNAIKASAGEDLCIIAKASDAFGDALESCSFSLFDGDNKIFMVYGLLNESNHWEFHIPASATETLAHKRYTYCVCDADHVSLCFKSPFYLV